MGFDSTKTDSPGSSVSTFTKTVIRPQAEGGHPVMDRSVTIERTKDGKSDKVTKEEHDVPVTFSKTEEEPEREPCELKQEACREIEAKNVPLRYIAESPQSLRIRGSAHITANPNVLTPGASRL